MRQRQRQRQRQRPMVIKSARSARRARPCPRPGLRSSLCPAPARPAPVPRSWQSVAWRQRKGCIVAGAVGSAASRSHFGASLEDHGPNVVLYRAGPQTARRAGSLRGHDHSRQSNATPKPLHRSSCSKSRSPPLPIAGTSWPDCFEPSTHGAKFCQTMTRSKHQVRFSFNPTPRGARL